MKTTDKYKVELNKCKPITLDLAAESWVRLCLADIEQKRQVINQDKDKNTYESNTK